MMTMTMRLKFAGTSADEGFTDIFWKPLNLKAQGNVLEDKRLAHQEPRDLEVRAREPWTQDLRAEELPASGLSAAASAKAGLPSQGLVEQDALSEMLEEMSLSTLLYYVLAGEGTGRDESS